MAELDRLFDHRGRYARKWRRWQRWRTTDRAVIDRQRHGVDHDCDDRRQRQALRQKPHPKGADELHNSAAGRIAHVSNFEPSLIGKWLQILKEVAPNVTRAAVMFNPKTAPDEGAFLVQGGHHITRCFSRSRVILPRWSCRSRASACPDYCRRDAVLHR